MEETKAEIAAKLAEAERQVEVWDNRLKRIINREKYLRSAKDRKRTHRLILYGAGIESQHKELEVLADDEVFILVESILRISDVQSEIVKAIENHNSRKQNGGD